MLKNGVGKYNFDTWRSISVGLGCTAIDIWKFTVSPYQEKLTPDNAPFQREFQGRQLAVVMCRVSQRIISVYTSIFMLLSYRIKSDFKWVFGYCTILING